MMQDEGSMNVNYLSYIEDWGLVGYVRRLEA